jgi:hypothetical protein
LAAPPERGVALGALQGDLTNVTKDENTPTGTITLTVGGKATTFLVDEATKFEFLRGTQHQPTSFLAEHRGEKAAVVPRPGNATSAALVQILLPAPPPPPPGPPAHVVTSPPKPSHVHGTVIGVFKNLLVMQLHHTNPPPPVSGVITDVTKDPNSDTGSLTLLTAAGPKTFAVNLATNFEVMQGDGRQPSSFLAEHKGEAAMVFPRVTHLNVAGKVDILFPGVTSPEKPKAIYRHLYHVPHNYLTAFLVQPGAQIGTVRDGHHSTANLGGVLPGEEVSVLPTGIHSHLAAAVDVLLPHTVHGVVTAAGPGSLTLKVHHQQGQAAIDTPVTIGLLPGTHFEAIEGKNRQPATAAALKPGEHVAVFPAGVMPHPAEAVEIHVGKPKFVSAHGVVASAAAAQIVVKGPKGAQAFQIAPSTPIVAHEGKTAQPVSMAAVKPGQTVSVFGYGTPPLAEKVEIHLGERHVANLGPKPTGKSEQPKAASTTKPVPKPKPLPAPKPPPRPKK